VNGCIAGYDRSRPFQVVAGIGTAVLVPKELRVDAMRLSEPVLRFNQEAGFNIGRKMLRVSTAEFGIRALDFRFLKTRLKFNAEAEATKVLQLGALGLIVR